MTASAIDLQNVPPPDVIQVLSFEETFAEILQLFLDQNPSFDAPVESDPIYKALEAAAYYAIKKTQEVNNAVRAVLLASAMGADLDQVAANVDTYRNPAATVTITGGSGAGATAEVVTVDGVITAINVTNPGSGYASDPTVTITGTGAGAIATATVLGGLVVSIGVTNGGRGYYAETDDSLRRRSQLSWERVTTAGSNGAYLYHALKADPRVMDAYPAGPDDHAVPGRVEVYVMSSEAANGVASQAVIDNVSNALTKEEIRPLTDQVIVSSITPVSFEIEAQLRFYSGPDRGEVLQLARDKCKAFVESCRKVGQNVPISGIYAALHQVGVSRVILVKPVAPLGYINVTYSQASYCTSNIDVTITDGGVGE